jgi:hypothetical protein
MALPLIKAPNLSNISGLSHAFTTRQGGVSEGSFGALNLGFSTGDNDDAVVQNYRTLCKELHITLDRLVGVRQVHGGKVEKLDPDVEADAQGDEYPLMAGCDGLCTDLSNRFLVIRAADCFPIIFADAKCHAIGIVHAGWRGTLANVVPHAIEKLNSLFGSDAADLQMAVGPGISMKAFEVSLGIAGLFEQNVRAHTSELRQNDSSAFVDLAAINIRLAREMGIRTENIWNANMCTYYDAARFYSYRRDGKHTGRQIAVVGWVS